MDRFAFNFGSPEESDLPSLHIDQASSRHQQLSEASDIFIFGADQTHSFSNPFVPPAVATLPIGEDTHSTLLDQYPTSESALEEAAMDYGYLSQQQRNRLAKYETGFSDRSTYGQSEGGMRRLPISGTANFTDFTSEAEPHTHATNGSIGSRHLPVSNPMRHKFSPDANPNSDAATTGSGEIYRPRDSYTDVALSPQVLDPYGPAQVQQGPKMSENRKTVFHEHFSVSTDDDELAKRYSQVPYDCCSRSSHRKSRASCSSILLLTLSIFSTLFSGIWLFASIVQPVWGKFISTSGALTPENASTLTALFAKLIEMSSVSVFVAHIGQVLTKRSFGDEAEGMSLAELTSLRNWIVQPGTLITDYDTVPLVIRKFLAWVCLAAALTAGLYTTASDALVTPKLKFGEWQHEVLTGYAMSSYANQTFIRQNCPTPITVDREDIAANACLDVSYSGLSYHNFLEFMSTWHDLVVNDTAKPLGTDGRPLGTATLYDNTTLTTSWIKGHGSSVARNFADHARIIDNVTLAIPHPGVYAAALHPINNILQPIDLSGVGEYHIKASAVSPAVGVMCVNMELAEIAPLVYAQWPNASSNKAGFGEQTEAHAGWQNDIPVVTDNEWYNSTAVDDIFRWGEEYRRRPPLFPMLPLDFNLITNASVSGDSLYVLGKKNTTTFYTLCELRSWLSPLCSTHLNVSGTAGASMRANCEDPNDPDRYDVSFPDAPVVMSNDWRDVAGEWHFSVDLNGGLTNNNASSHRILTELILDRPAMPDLLPSMAEGLAVLVASTLVSASVDAQLRHEWEHTALAAAPGLPQRLHASVMSQEYTSSHTKTWHAVFYLVLGLVFVLNVVCLASHAVKLHSGTLLTDFTDPANAFALAINSPPSQAMKGCCGGGPDRADLAVAWRVAYSQASDHYFFEEAPAGEKTLRRGGYTGVFRRGAVMDGGDEATMMPGGVSMAALDRYY